MMLAALLWPGLVLTSSQDATRCGDTVWLAWWKPDIVCLHTAVHVVLYIYIYMYGSLTG